MPRDESIGGVTWHSSGPDEGPDVGISVTLGPKEELWAGEISRTLFDQCKGPEKFDNDFGWFLVHHKAGGPALLAKFADQYEAQAFMEQVAAWVRKASH